MESYNESPTKPKAREGESQSASKQNDQHHHHPHEVPETIPFVEEPLVFEDGTEQIKFNFATFEVEDLENFPSFSFTFTVTLNNKLDKLESDVVFFQTGTSTVDKNLIVGISRTKRFYVTFINHKRKPETIYSQLALKSRASYDLAVVFNHEFNSTDIALYVNGQIEGMMSIGARLQMLEGSAYFGSDSNINSFHGVIADPMIHLKPLNNVEVREFLAINKIEKNQSLYQYWISKKEYNEYTNHYSKHKKLPVNLVRSYPLNEQSYLTLKQTQIEMQKSQVSGEGAQAEQEDDESHEGILHRQTETLRNFLLTNEILYIKARDLSYSYEWVLITLQVLSPPVDDKGATPKLSFKSLHFDVCTDPSYEPKYFPCYVIELEKFMKVISHVDAKLTKDDVVTLAQVIDCLDQHPKYGPIVIYDKLILAIRNASLSKEEIKQLQSKGDEGEEEQGEQNHQHKQVGVVKNQIISTADGQSDLNFDSRGVLSLNEHFSPKHIEFYVDKLSQKIYGLLVEYMYVEAFQITSQTFERDGGFNPSDCEKYVVECEPDEEFVQVSAAKTKGQTGEFISYLEFHTSKDKGYKIGKAPDSDQVKTYKVDPTNRLKGFVGKLSDALVSFGVMIWEPIQGVPEKEEEKVDLTSIPEVPSSWNMGHFQIVINHWSDWPRAQSTTSLKEADFAHKFNEIGNRIKEIFPNAEIIGNYDKPRLFGIFEVYIRGVGSPYEHDEQGRLFLFKNHSGGSSERYPRFGVIYDTLCLLSMEYGDSAELEKAQEAYFKRYSNLIPPRFKNSHDFPYSYIPPPENTQAPKANEKKKKAH